MIDHLRLALEERDFAIQLITVTTEKEALSATVRVFLDLFLGSGVAVSSELRKEPVVDSGGTYADVACRCLYADNVESDRIRAFPIPIADSQGVCGKIMVITPAAEVDLELLEGLSHRLAALLAGVLRRIHAMDHVDEGQCDRDLLIRELRHRTRNSLQMIKGTVTFLVQSSMNNVSMEFLESLDERLCALVSVHDMLSWSDSPSAVSAKAYFGKLSQELKRLALNDMDSLVAHYDAERDVTLSLERAVTIGLILNELVTNSVKHSTSKHVSMNVHVDVVDGTLVVRYFDQPISSSVEMASESFSSYSWSGSGLALIDALLNRARGTRIEDHAAPYSFAARFPVS